MKFDVRFHGPFRVATGLAGRGSDVTVDPRNPLPAPSLKGLMRAAAKQILPRQERLRNEVFGTARTPSPWSWSSAVFLESTTRRRARVAIDEATGTAVPEALQFAEEVWAETATFSIDQQVHLGDEQRRQHELVLLASAHAVHSLGGNRRRGLGWVGIRGTDPILDGGRLEAVVDLAARQ